jgi:ribosomal protein S18 acetylase RimI-like enzyme
LQDLKDWTVRRAGADDVDRLALVGGATFLETFAGVLDGDAVIAHCRREHSPEAYRRFFEAGGAAWLAETVEGGAPIGFAMVGKPDVPGMDPDGGDAELKRIYLLSRFHGRGLGAELMEAAVQEAAARGARRLLLGVYARNARAIRFYERNGFERLSTRRFRVGDREYDDLVLARRLQG